MEGHLKKDGTLEERRTEPNRFGEIHEKCKVFIGQNKKEIAELFAGWQNNQNEAMLVEFLTRKGEDVPSIRMRDAEGANGDFIEAGMRDLLTSAAIENVNVRGVPAGRFNELIISFSSTLFTLIKKISVEKRAAADKLKQERSLTKEKAEEIIKK
ncbi:MAG: hypothetical protein WC269_05490 [Candidatus Gracilibacteria bacterium]|jgi:hypothetical protein